MLRERVRERVIAGGCDGDFDFDIDRRGEGGRGDRTIYLGIY